MVEYLPTICTLGLVPTTMHIKKGINKLGGGGARL